MKLVITIALIKKTVVDKSTASQFLFVVQKYVNIISKTENLCKKKLEIFNKETKMIVR